MKYKPSARYAAYVRKILACGHWADGEQLVGNHNAILIHQSSGQTISYSLHDGGNDINSARRMARDAEQLCACSFLEARGRKKSRKAVVMYDDARARADAKKRGDRADAAADLIELREACGYASSALRRDPSSATLRAHFQRLRTQLALSLKEPR